MPSYVCAHIQYEWLTGVSPLYSPLSFWWILGKGGEGQCLYNYVVPTKVRRTLIRTTIFFLSFLHYLDSFFLADTVVLEPGLHLQMLEAEMILKQDTISAFLHLYVTTS